MLELEKKYKIQRLQDIGSTPPLTPLGATITRSASSAQPNPVLKARHASALPAAPRQRPHMMMKASRRASALPSLSISVPHPVSSAVAVRTDDPEAQATPEPIPQREVSKDTAERTKTVTFSEPEGDEEDAELSDQSSICQSPSWAVYGQSKKKDKKREAAEKKKEDNRQEKANRKSFTRRLSKQPPPQSAPQGRPSLSGERSQSAPDLEQYQKLSDRNLNRSGSHYPPDSMIHHHNLLNQPAPAENSKPKSKGLFSGFRLPGNSSNNSQKTESSASARASMEDVSSLRAGSAYALHKSGPRGDMDFLNPRKPPSIMSNSSSSQSQSSQELKQNKERRSSNHGRSNSLLSRLKGPSYLYAKHSDSSDEVTPKRPGSSEKIESTEERNAVIQNVTRIAPSPKVLGSIDQREDKATRGRQLQLQAQVLQQRESSSDSEMGNLGNAQNHQSRQQIIEGPSAHDGRRRPQNRKLQSGAQRSGASVPLPEPTSPRQFGHDELRSTRGRDPRRNFAHPSQPESHVQHQVATSELPSPAMSPRSNKSYASVYTDAVDQLSESQSFHAETEGNPPAHTNASAFQPESRKGERDGLISNRVGGKPGVLYPSGHEQGELRRSPRVAEMRGQRTKPNRDDRFDEADMPPPTVVQAEDQVYRAPKPSDYFTFVSESYAPPSLELRSPVEDDFQEDETAEDIYEDEDLVWVTSTDGNEESEKSDRDHVEDQQAGGDARAAEVCDSPTLSAHDRESYVPPLDGMGVYSAVPSTLETNKPFRVTVEDDPSQTVSERSSSSTHNEPLHSPSTATTPDISRPQSQRGPSADISRDRANDSGLLDGRPPKKLYRSKMAESSVPRPKGMDANDKFGDGNASSVDADHSDDTTRGGTPDHVLSRSSSSIRSPTLRAFAEPLLEEAESDEGPPRRQPLAPKAQSSIDLSTNSALLQDRYQTSALKRNKAAFSSVSLPSSPPPELETEAPPRLRSAMKMPRQDSSGSQDSSNIVSAGAAYLKEARKAAPTPGGSSSRSVRPMFTPRTSLGPPKTGIQDKKGDPIAKVLVQCCNCQFFHDMPSRVYECMAKPDSVIEDKLLGVSAAITTTVRCPWCAHGMTTTCCSGYAALVYLKEKLHGQ